MNVEGGRPAGAPDEPPCRSDDGSPVRREGRSPADSAQDRIDPGLQFVLETGPDAQVWVTVTFQPVPGPSELRRLGLPHSGENPVTGLLGEAQIRALAARDDVVQIDPRPRYRLS